MRGGGVGGRGGVLLEEAAVALEEEDVEEEVEGQGAEVEEGCQEAPELRPGLARLLCLFFSFLFLSCLVVFGREMGGERRSYLYLVLQEDGPHGEEELQGRHNVALDQHGDGDGQDGPGARADGHLVEPLLERELTSASSGAEVGAFEHVGHSGDLVRVWCA